MRNLFIVCAFMFSALSMGQMSFAVSNDFDVTTPMSTTDANIGWFMNDDILVSFSMGNWDNFTVGARYYTGFCDNMFIEATTTADANEINVTDANGANMLDDDGNPMMEEDGTSTYKIGAAIGWTKSLGIWKLQFEPKVVLDDIQDFTPTLQWALRFNL